MRVVTDKPRFVLVTGLPRSGTTLLCSILNSAENAVCLSEPRNAIRTHGTFHTDKLGEPGARQKMDAEGVVAWLNGCWLGAGYDLCGVKEVCQRMKGELGMYLDYAVPHADTILVVIRDPLEIVASQKAVLGFTLAESIVGIADFVYWVGLQRRAKRVLRFVSYEKLCADPLGHLNEALAGDFAIEGPFVKMKMEGFGDNRGCLSEAIEPARARREGLTDDEAAAVRAVAGEWF